MVFLSGATVEGGVNGECGNCDGSDGLHLEAGAVWFVDSTFQAGATILGIPGQDIDAPAGSVTDLRETSRELEVSALLKEGDSGILAYEGAPGDSVAVFVSTGTGFVLLPGKAGVWHLGSTTIGPFPLGTADGGGVVQVAFEAPVIDPLQVLPLFVQAVAQEALQGKLRIGGASMLVVVDSSP